MTTERNESVLTEDPAAATPEATTQLEQVSTEELKAEIENLRQQNDKLQQSYKGLQTTVNKKDEQLKGQQEIREELAENRRMMKLLGTIVAERYDDPEEQKKALERFDSAEKDLEAKRQQAEAAARIQATNDELIAIYHRAEAVTDDVDMLHNIRNLLRSGDKDLAEKKVAKLEQNSKAEESTVTDEKTTTLEKRIAELEKQLKIANGELASETGQPSNTAANEAAIREAYRKNPNDPVNYKNFNDLIAKRGGKF